MPQPDFSKLVELMARLRGPDGCPWDRQQTFDSIKPFLLEETYEVVDAVARRDWDELASELGDLLLQIVFFAQMASEEGRFTIHDVIDRIHTKMVRRHPHVFGTAVAETPEDVLRNWEKLKAEEKKQRLAERGKEYAPPQSVLEGVSSTIPSLLEAFQLSSRAAHVGFDWKRLDDLLDKLNEEMRELASEAFSSERSPAQVAKVEDEVGDLLFTAVNVARFLKVDPESALRKTNRKFRHRFQWMERELARAGKTPQQASLDDLDALWNRSKSATEEFGC